MTDIETPERQLDTPPTPEWVRHHRGRAEYTGQGRMEQAGLRVTIGNLFDLLHDRFLEQDYSSSFHIYLASRRAHELSLNAYAGRLADAPHGMGDGIELEAVYRHLVRTISKGDMKHLERLSIEVTSNVNLLSSLLRPSVGYFEQALQELQKALDTRPEKNDDSYKRGEVRPDFR